jgi:hypothetical protein
MTGEYSAPSPKEGLLDDFESRDFISPMGAAWIPEDDSVNGGDSTAEISLAGAMTARPA